MMGKYLFLLVVTGSSTLLACSSASSSSSSPPAASAPDAGNSSDSGSALDSLCDQLPARICAARQPCCAKSVGFVEDVCKQAAFNQCTSNVAAVKAGTMEFHADKVDACLAKLAEAKSCFVEGIEPLYDLASDFDTCGVFVGAAAPGDSCAYDVDCAPQPDSYTKCNTIDVNGGRKCGSAAWLAAGKACSTITNDATHQCGPGLYCDIAMGAQFGKCITQPRKMPGEACTDPGDCVSFDCKAGVCADTGTTHLLWNSVRCGVAQH